MVVKDDPDSTEFETECMQQSAADLILPVMPHECSPPGMRLANLCTGLGHT